MQRNSIWGLVACGLLTACGCANSAAITRGQSPSAAQQASFGYRGSVHEAATEHFQGTELTHYWVDSSSGSMGCPPGGPDGYGCPRGVNCPSGGCPDGSCQFPHHGYSFSYERPNDLVYPPANQPGGAVVYPYYTMRGPSDFFRAK